jgi:hypothetical protein
MVGDYDAKGGKMQVVDRDGADLYQSEIKQWR